MSVRERWVETSIVVAAAVVLTAVFWRQLWLGRASMVPDPNLPRTGWAWFSGGFIGGDVYSYYYPQKSYFAERLHAGEFPLWNNRTGHGYPLIGESQTAAFYPPNVPLYSTFSVNTAYNINHLLHYVLAFVFTWMYARRIGLTTAGALLAALVYTYAWFPPRCCLEWAIITGAYLPLALWCVEAFLQTRRLGCAVLLCAALTLQLLAGHFNLAFITLLLLAAYVPLRLWWAAGGLPEETLAVRGRSTAVLALSVTLAFGLAAVQLVPTWELKQQSQRVAINREFNPAYGFIPPLYLSQVFTPWMWYTPQLDLDRALQKLTALSISAHTNKVEAHLYFGLVPFLLAVGGLIAPRFGAVVYHRPLWLWIWIGVLAAVFATGWPVLVLQHLPGFGFFRGPGRYGIVTTLAAGLLAGAVFGRWLESLQRRRILQCVLAATVFCATTADLWLVSRLVTYTFLLEPFDVKLHSKSELRPLLAREASPVRLFAPGANITNLLGVAATPVYLGIGPAEYFDPELRMPEPPPDDEQPYKSATPEQISWLQRAGVTHVVSFRPLNPQDWPTEVVWQGWDALLSPVWQRHWSEPIYLSALKDSRGRVAFAEPDETATAQIERYAANSVEISAVSENGGTLILTDLMDAGWSVTVDGEPAEAIRVEGMYRGVRLSPGQHTVVWTYRPAGVMWGAAMSGVTLLVIVGFATVGRRRFAQILMQQSRRQT